MTQRIESDPSTWQSALMGVSHLHEVSCHFSFQHEPIRDFLGFRARLQVRDANGRDRSLTGDFFLRFVPRDDLAPVEIPPPDREAIGVAAGCIFGFPFAIPTHTDRNPDLMGWQISTSRGLDILSRNNDPSQQERPRTSNATPAIPEIDYTQAVRKITPSDITSLNSAKTDRPNDFLYSVAIGTPIVDCSSESSTNPSQPGPEEPAMIMTVDTVIVESPTSQEAFSSSEDFMCVGRREALEKMRSVNSTPSGSESPNALPF